MHFGATAVNAGLESTLDASHAGPPATRTARQPHAAGGCRTSPEHDQGILVENSISAGKAGSFLPMAAGAWSLSVEGEKSKDNVRSAAPVSRPLQLTGIIRSHPILDGLHHHYVRV
jgi:hypothetical protein